MFFYRIAFKLNVGFEENSFFDNLPKNKSTKMRTDFTVSQQLKE